MRTHEINNELRELKEIENTIVRKPLQQKANKGLFNFRKFKTIRSFGEDILK